MGIHATSYEASAVSHANGPSSRRSPLGMIVCVVCGLDDRDKLGCEDPEGGQEKSQPVGVFSVRIYEPLSIHHESICISSLAHNIKDGRLMIQLKLRILTALAG